MLRMKNKSQIWFRIMRKITSITEKRGGVCSMHLITAIEYCTQESDGDEENLGKLDEGPVV